MPKPFMENAPAFRAAALFIAGILLAKIPFVQESSILGLTLILLSVLLFVLAIDLRRNVTGQWLSFTTAAICLFAGIVGSSLDQRQAHRIPDSLFRGPAVLVGTIDDSPSFVYGRSRFIFHTSAVISDGRRIPLETDALMTIIPARRDSLVPVLRYGMELCLLADVSRPGAERNPGEFSPRQYYEANGILLLGRVKGFSRVMITDSAGGNLVMRDVVFPIRSRILDAIDRDIGGEPGEFLKGLLLGERSGMNRATRDAFVSAGVAHVLAVSGSNVAVVAAILLLLLELVRISGLWRYGVTALGLLLYMLLTGGQPSVVRATIMAIAFLAARAFEKKVNAYNALGVSALLILAGDTRQLYDIGFQLSFGAVLSIVALYPKMNSWISLMEGSAKWRRSLVWLLRVCAVSLAATLGTLPLTAIAFGKVSVVGILANILVIPATGVSVVIGMISACLEPLSPWLAWVYAAVNQLVLRWTLAFALYAGNLPFASLDTSRFSLADAVPFYAGLALVFFFVPHALGRGVVFFLAALNIAAFVPSPTAYQPREGKLRVTFIDVGQGDAVLAELPDGRNILVDTGPRTDEYDAGDRIVAPYLRRRGITTIHMLVISHPHSDHIGGLPAILRQFQVLQVVEGSQGTPAANLTTSRVHASMRPLLGDSTAARLYVLLPLQTQTVPDSSLDNINPDNASLVVKLQYGAVSFLLTGDADQTAEAAMVDAYGNFLHTTVLKLGHHGSNTSSSSTFLDAVSPEQVVISVGKNNKFNHPSKEVLERCEERGVALTRTDEDGAAIFETDGQKLSLISWR